MEIQELIQLLSITLGSGFISSWITNLYNVRLQNKSRIKEIIKNIYLDNGIDPILTDVSEYGTASIISIMYVVKNYDPVKNNIAVFDEIKQRDSYNKIVEYDYKNVNKYVNKLILLDTKMRLYSCVVNVLFNWSLFMQDIVKYEWIIKDPKWIDAATGSSNLIQDMQLYLITRLTQLSYWFREKDYDNYDTLRNDLIKKKILEPLFEEMEEFNTVEDSD